MSGFHGKSVSCYSVLLLAILQDSFSIKGHKLIKNDLTLYRKIDRVESHGGHADNNYWAGQ